ncbi:hypothetical protein SISSUDRAFT_593942 [Sistotremastrum suecicum HHB10207 ss-3]|uniref:Uncharacterized protein n=1 Tax=Sistotremastrum suecicum HHB10207 ss-3 TaxID=1314776 RepID=A0A166I6W8_9AGAM|nr:hypothetical protein SISSUDRAFT_593942 [Sistotremastrum suecicum HHB10207 ss-3]
MDVLQSSLVAVIFRVILSEFGPNPLLNSLIIGSLEGIILYTSWATLPTVNSNDDLLELVAPVLVRFSIDLIVTRALDRVFMSILTTVLLFAAAQLFENEVGWGIKPRHSSHRGPTRPTRTNPVPPPNRPPGPSSTTVQPERFGQTIAFEIPPAPANTVGTDTNPENEASSSSSSSSATTLRGDAEPIGINPIPPSLRPGSQPQSQPPPPQPQWQMQYRPPTPQPLPTITVHAPPPNNLPQVAPYNPPRNPTPANAAQGPSHNQAPPPWPAHPNPRPPSPNSGIGSIPGQYVPLPPSMPPSPAIRPSTPGIQRPSSRNGPGQAGNSGNPSAFSYGNSLSFIPPGTAGPNIFV